MCNCQGGHSINCQQSIRLEVGKKYRARSGTVYEVVAQVKDRFIVTHGRQPDHSLAWRYSNGKFNESSATIAPNDLIEEYKEPIINSVNVVLQQFSDGSTGIYFGMGIQGKVIGRKTITVTEGEGMP